MSAIVYRTLRLLSLSLLLLLAACSSTQKEEVAAEVYGEKLLVADVHQMVPENVQGEDSVTIAELYIRRWIEEQLLAHKAKNDKSIDMNEIDQQVEKYKQSLLAQSYENFIIKQRTNTDISDKEIADYYEQHKNGFELFSDIAKVQYLILQKDAATTPELQKKFFETFKNDKERLAFEAMCEENAVEYNLDDTTWVPIADIVSKIPLEDYTQKQFVQNHRKIVVSDTAFVYLLYVKDFKVQNELSPLAFESDNIKDIIISHRERQVAEKLRQELYDQALKKEKIKRYTEKKKSTRK